MLRRTGAIVVLAGLYLLAAEIGNNFGQALTVFGLFMWVIAAGMVVYLMLFRGMRLDLFGNADEEASLPVETGRPHEEAGADPEGSSDEDMPAIRSKSSAE